MKIQAGKYYRRRDGEVIGPATTRTDKGSSYQWTVGGLFFTDDGRYQARGPDCDYDLIAEVTVTDVLPFELKAGEKYETVKMDGAPGPVVTLKNTTTMRSGFLRLLPFESCAQGASLFFMANGQGIDADSSDKFCITAPYVAPPPTIAERLEKSLELFGDWRKGEEALALVRGCIAELKGAKA
jgi:hypothetical protein